MFLKNFLNISDLSENLLRKIINPDFKFNNTLLKNKCIGLIFEKYSTRTRLSFTVGIHQLGALPVEIKFQDLNIARDESFEDTFRAMNCYLDGLVYRTSKHENLLKVSKYFDKPIINALSNLSHPCQTISDLFTIYQHFNNLNIHILWMGDMNNVCFSLVQAVNSLKEMRLTICCPKEISDKKVWKINDNVKVINDLSAINFSDVKCIMTDVFISMNDLENDNKIKALDSFAVKKEILNKAHQECVFMHCLPANIGKEVTDEVFNSKKSIVWKQAKNRLYAQKNLLSLISW